MICLVFRVMDVPKSLCGREAEARTGRTFPKADLHVWQSLDESLGLFTLCQALMPRRLACNLCHLYRQYQSYQIVLPQCEP